ncbi:unnamed protein product, partial [Mesorhabditis spiculigera]
MNKNRSKIAKLSSYRTKKSPQRNSGKSTKNSGSSGPCLAPKPSPKKKETAKKARFSPRPPTTPNPFSNTAEGEIVTKRQAEIEEVQREIKELTGDLHTWDMVMTNQFSQFENLKKLDSTNAKMADDVARKMENCNESQELLYRDTSRHINELRVAKQILCQSPAEELFSLLYTNLRWLLSQISGLCKRFYAAAYMWYFGWSIAISPATATTQEEVKELRTCDEISRR